MGTKVKRTCEHCQHHWTADLDFEHKLTREAVRGLRSSAKPDLLSLNLTQAIQRRVRAQVTDVALGDSMAAQELRLSRTCPNCQTYFRYQEARLSEKDFAGFVAANQQDSATRRGVLAALSEFDQLLDLLANQQITPQEFTERRQQIMSF